MPFLVKKIFSVALAALLLASNTGCDEKNSENNNVEIPTPPPVVEEEIIPPEPQVEKVSFAGFGDNIIYYGNVRDAKSLAIEGGREYNFKPMFKNVENIIKDADISFINQETLMCGQGYAPSYYPHFNSPQDLGYDLCELGYDVINIANNHMLDKGADGLSKTIDFYKNSLDCLMIGGYENAEDYEKIRTVEKNGITFSFLSYTEMTNGLVKSAQSPIAIPYIKDEDIIRQVSFAKECSEVVVVSVHWGDEGTFTPNDEQKRVAQLFADCGVDVILGHHPHVIQPVEYLTGKDGNKTLCVYSLGNFAAEQAYDYNMVGGIISFDVISIDDAEPTIENVVFTPTVFHFPGNFYGNTVYLMQDYTPELAAIHGVRTYYGHKLSYEQLLKYAKDTIDEEFLPVALK